MQRRDLEFGRGINRAAGQATNKFSQFNYQVQKFLGNGNFGATFKAVDKQTGQPVAIKFIFPDAESMSDGKRELDSYMAVAATDIANKQCFPSLLCFHDAGQLTPANTEYNQIFPQLAQAFADVRKGRGSLQSGAPIIYIVTDFLKGEDVEKLSLDPNKHLTKEEVRRFIYDMLTALRELHSRGLAHRDVKPANIMRAADDRYVLIDFGLVCHDKACSPSGTVAYLPNEILIANGAVSLTTSMAGDYFGLALSLYELINGRWKGGVRARNNVYSTTSLPLLNTDDKVVNTIYKALLTDYDYLASAPQAVNQLIDLVQPQAPQRIRFERPVAGPAPGGLAARPLAGQVRPLPVREFGRQRALSNFY